MMAVIDDRAWESYKNRTLGAAMRRLEVAQKRRQGGSVVAQATLELTIAARILGEAESVLFRGEPISIAGVEVE